MLRLGTSKRLFSSHAKNAELLLMTLAAGGKDQLTIVISGTIT